MENLQLYSANTPNGWKIEIVLEELGEDYDFHPIDIGNDEQFKEDFLRISPNNKIPALVDLQGPDGKEFSIFESGAILIYLAEKFASPLLPEQADIKYRTLTWLMFQMGGIGPMLGQVYHFTNAAPEKIPYALDRYTKEANRLYKVMDTRLAEVDYLAGDAYTIADIACFPWILSHEAQHHHLDSPDAYPHLFAWYQRIMGRPAVAEVLDNIRKRIDS